MVGAWISHAAKVGNVRGVHCKDSLMLSHLLRSDGVHDDGLLDSQNAWSAAQEHRDELPEVPVVAEHVIPVSRRIPREHELGNSSRRHVHWIAVVKHPPCFENWVTHHSILTELFRAKARGIGFFHRIGFVSDPLISRDHLRLQSSYA